MLTTIKRQKEEEEGAEEDEKDLKSRLRDSLNVITEATCTDVLRLTPNQLLLAN